MRREGVLGAVVLAMLAVTAGNAEGQSMHRRDSDHGASRAGAFGISFIAADPVGDLGLFFDQGFGLQLDLGVPLDEEGRFRLRADGGVLVYGYERQNYCFSQPIGCRIGVDVTTTNSILFAGFGPEFVFSTGPVQPYLHGTMGLSYFVTSSSLSGENDYGDGAFDTTHFDDVVMAWTVGGGLRVRVSHGAKPVSLDFGVEHHENGVVDFLTEGDIVDNPDGSITLFPNRSEANLVTFRFGVSIGIMD